VSVESVNPNKLLGRGVWVCVNEHTDDWEKRKVTGLDVHWSLQRLSLNAKVEPYYYIYHVEVMDRGGAHHGYNAYNVYLHSYEVPRRRLPDTPEARELRQLYRTKRKELSSLKLQVYDLQVKLACMSIREPKGKNNGNI